MAVVTYPRPDFDLGDHEEEESEQDYEYEEPSAVPETEGLSWHSTLYHGFDPRVTGTLNPLQTF